MIWVTRVPPPLTAIENEPSAAVLVLPSSGWSSTRTWAPPTGAAAPEVTTVPVSTDTRVSSRTPAATPVWRGAAPSVSWWAASTTDAGSSTGPGAGGAGRSPNQPSTKTLRWVAPVLLCSRILPVELSLTTARVDTLSPAAAARVAVAGREAPSRYARTLVARVGAEVASDTTTAVAPVAGTPARPATGTETVPPEPTTPLRTPAPDRVSAKVAAGSGCSRSERSSTVAPK